MAAEWHLVAFIDHEGGFWSCLVLAPAGSTCQFFLPVSFLCPAFSLLSSAHQAAGQSRGRFPCRPLGAQESARVWIQLVLGSNPDSGTYKLFLLFHLIF